jgi:hypothetical protein
LTNEWRICQTINGFAFICYEQYNSVGNKFSILHLSAMY